MTDSAASPPVPAKAAGQRVNAKAAGQRVTAKAAGQRVTAKAAGQRVTAKAVLTELRRRGETLAAAESLTGGLLSATIVNVPGASTVFRGALIVYATDLKQSLAGVDAALLAERGPVDPDVALALARGALAKCGARWGVATTGVAGPDLQDGVPVGTVFVAVAGPSSLVRSLKLNGTRAQIRRATVEAALALLREAIPAEL